MAIEIKAPTFPESVADGTVATWHKQPGDAVKRDELIVDIETDKVVMEVLAEADGVMGDIAKAEGETVLSGELLHLQPSRQTPRPRPRLHRQSQLKSPCCRLLRVNWQKKTALRRQTSPALVRVVASLRKMCLTPSKPRRTRQRRRLPSQLQRLQQPLLPLKGIVLRSACP